MNSSDRPVGFPSRQSIELFHEAHGGFAILLDPFGMLDPQVVLNLLPQLRVGVDLVRHCHWLGEGFKSRYGSHQGLGGIVDERWCHERATAK
jgi:hypothetical protein